MVKKNEDFFLNKKKVKRNLQKGKDTFAKQGLVEVC